jgi:hypothetical protein
MRPYILQSQFLLALLAEMSTMIEGFVPTHDWFMIIIKSMLSLNGAEEDITAPSFITLFLLTIVLRIKAI